MKTPKKTPKKKTTKKQTKKRVPRVTKPKDIIVISPVDPNSRLVVAAEMSDDAIIEQELLGEVLPYFIYQFGSGDKKVTGLTVKGVSEVVRRLNRDKKSGYNIRLNPDHMKIERDVEQDGEKGVAVTVYAENLLDGNSAWGTKFEAYKKKGRNGTYKNEFAVEKALSKAERNAKRKLIPEPAAMKMIEHLISGGAAVKQLATPPPQARIMTPAKPKASSIDQIKEMVRNAVRTAKNSSVAIELDKKTQDSTKFDAAFKKEIRALAGSKVDQLDNK